MSAELLIVEDDSSLRDALADTLQLAGFHCLTAADGREALSVLEQENVQLVVSDVQMRPMDGIQLLHELKKRHPELPVLLMTAFATVKQAVDAMRVGASDYLVKPFDAQVLVNKVNQYVRGGVDESSTMVTADPASLELAKLAKRVAASEATVMITGPSGAGKEVVARYIHQQSKRGQGPFIAINCAAIPDNMLEAVLFGYEKGAFTGAHKTSPGKFEMAQGGTLLLDEISEMDLGLQAKLLRVLQEREVERLGSQQLIRLDVRVLATSNRDMPEQVREGLFREDLFYRLNVFPLGLLPLDERRQDILPLAETLLAKAAASQGRAIAGLSREAERSLLAHCWPGNVRELDNVLQRALILMSGDQIEAQDLHFETLARIADEGEPEPDPQNSLEPGLGGDLKIRERELIVDALKEHQGSKKKAAESLGISPRTLRYKLQKLRESGVQIQM